MAKRPVFRGRGPDEVQPATNFADVVRRMWNYHERINKQAGVITAWLTADRITVKGRANFERALDQLRQLHQTQWSKPNPASSMGNNTYVIRFKDTGGLQLRVFGHFYHDHGAFVMTSNGYEKDNVYYPNNYADITDEHKASCDKEFSAKTKAYGSYCEVCTQPAGELNQDGQRSLR